jgi:hypothetical protein
VPSEGKKFQITSYKPRYEEMTKNVLKKQLHCNGSMRKTGATPPVLKEISLHWARENTEAPFCCSL